MMRTSDKVFALKSVMSNFQDALIEYVREYPQNTPHHIGINQQREVVIQCPLQDLIILIESSHYSNDDSRGLLESYTFAYTVEVHKQSMGENIKHLRVTRDISLRQIDSIRDEYLGDFSAINRNDMFNQIRAVLREFNII